MKISAVIITLNEEDRLPDALASLQGIADEIVVVDSYSTDRTLAIASAAQARVWQNRFEDYGQQKNFAMGKAAHEWILNLDADERVSPELKRAIAELKEGAAPADAAAFAIKRKTFYLGRWIRHSGWYPDRKVRLFRKSAADLAGQDPRKAHGNGAGRAPGRRHPALHLPRHRRPRAPAGAIFRHTRPRRSLPAGRNACSCACCCCRRSHSCAITPGAWASSTASRGWSSPRSSHGERP